MLSVNSAIAAPKSKSSGNTAKERLVLMPLRIAEEDANLRGAMESALVEGLENKYEVFAGDRVRQKAKEIFSKESKTTKHDCDETRCMQGIAQAFQAELIGIATVTKQGDGYFLALSIQNIFDEKAVYTKSIPCEGCNAYKVVDKLKELSGATITAAPADVLSAVAPVTLPAIPAAPRLSAAANDAESQTWAEIVKSNTPEDYQLYLESYPQGRYAKQAAEQKQKLEAYAKAKAEAEQRQQEDLAWNAAQQADTVNGYQKYLDQYSQGRYVALGKIKIKKAQAVAQAEADAYRRDHPPFRDCADCPEMVVIPAGSFDIGSNTNNNEKPVHRVTIGKSYAIGKTEVTQGQWKAVMGNNPSNFATCGDNCPVEQVSWNDVQEYILKLNAMTGKQYRLPTEAEWEYACRAGGKQEYCGSDDVGAVAWYGANVNPAGNSAKTTNPVATKQANAWGLYDMSGNVWEWVADSYHDSYSGAPVDGSEWQGDGATRVLRGGSWSNRPQYSRSAYRDRDEASGRDDVIGFRLARTLP